jgi:hypothetical protein
MGSVSWRNPEPRMASYSLSWQFRNEDDLFHIGESFRLHLCAEEGRWDELFRDSAEAASQVGGCLHHPTFDDRTATAAWFTELARFRNALRSPDAVDFYFDLSDEVAYLRARGKEAAARLVDAIDGLRAAGAQAIHPPAPPPAGDQALLDELLGDSNLFKLLKARARGSELQ